MQHEEPALGGGDLEFGVWSGRPLKGQREQGLLLVGAEADMSLQTGKVT